MFCKIKASIFVKQKQKTMIQHIGKHVKDRLKEHGTKLNLVAIDLEIDQSTLWRWLADANMSNSKIMKIQRVTGIDFTTDFPELIALEPNVSKNYKQLYFEMTLKYTELQEKYYKLLEAQSGH